MAQGKYQLETQMTDSEEGAGRYLLALFFVIAIGLVLPAALNFLVNPHGLYASPLDLERNRDDQRLIKIELLKQANTPPRALILGSSRVRSFNPDYATELFGLKTFHAGLSVGRFPDWLSVTRYTVNELDYPIKVILLGIDPDSFIASTNYIHHPAHFQELRRHLTHPIEPWIKSRIHIWSPNQTKISLKLLLSTILGLGKNDQLFSQDGLQLNNRFHDTDEVIKILVHGHSFPKQVNKNNLGDFNALLDLANERGITIIAFLTLETPQMRDLLKHTYYSRTRAEAKAILHRSEKKGLIFCDLDQVEFDWNDYVDPHHPGDKTGRELIELLHGCALENGAL